MASSLLTGLVAYYKLDESSGNPADSSGAGLTLTNNGTTGFASALVNNGITQGTSNSTKNLSRADGLGMNLTTSYSISVWVKANEEISSGTWGILEICESTRDVATRVVYEYNGGTRQLTFQRNTVNGSFFTVNYPITLGTSDFYNLVMTYDGATLTAYVNNVSVGSIASTGTGTGAVNKTSVGSLFNEGTGNFTDYASMTIDEIGVWSKSLSSTERGDLYNNRLGNQYPFLNYSVSVSETSTGTEGYVYLINKSVNISETSTSIEAIRITSPSNTKWANQSKSSTTWSNSNKS